ncbi:MAG: hypothetical protein A2902_03410 [Elusimicrobia bacterium RIFCSPLOWO2_01_FULL_64_13]|nr:MAG: hypothetical protein A2636_05190 [Elusimicrobia bacterium RIFCSPHIGHO2_01_FULL_64_10]OGR94955.1 MAG: hypothetical protein A2902_03410 [Elusimicrobia bacterium RIFCSPLOWO2_01_FULL_64_13]
MKLFKIVLAWILFCGLFPWGLGAAERGPGEILVKVRPEKCPDFRDDGDPAGLGLAVARSLLYYSQIPSGTVFRFGKETVSLEDMVRSLEGLESFLESGPDRESVADHVRKHFQAYSSPGSDGKGRVSYSAYHEYSLTASLKKTAEYRYPVYGRPRDLVDVNSEKFDPRKKGERIVGRVSGTELAPYYSREEIDSGLVLKGRELEIAWARDPMDVLFLQIQGSGWVNLPDSTETYHIRYAGDNGLPFRSVGTVLIERGAIPRGQFNRRRFAEYMNGLPGTERQAILNLNPRYVFFEIVSATNSTRGALLVPLTSGRSVAADPKVYPQGALAWISTRRPDAGPDGTPGPRPLRRFVLNQDEGGAIQGPGRIDFFAGGGTEAERMAQKLWYPGELYFFAPITRTPR